MLITLLLHPRLLFLLEYSNNKSQMMGKKKDSSHVYCSKGEYVTHEGRISDVMQRLQRKIKKKYEELNIYVLSNTNQQ